MREPIPLPVRTFVIQHIESVEMLEVLLRLRATPERWWPAQELARALLRREAEVAHDLERLVVKRLVATREMQFRYAAPDEDHLIEELELVYMRRRRSLLRLIYGSDVRSARTLADAFRIRRRRP